jgi:hypothetical protein
VADLYTNRFLTEAAGTYIGFGIILLAAGAIAVATRGRLSYPIVKAARPAASASRPAPGVRATARGRR